MKPNVNDDKLGIVFLSLYSDMRGHCLNRNVYHEDVQDVIHNAWLRVLDGLHSYDGRYSELDRWIMGCLKHAIGDWYRIDTFGRGRQKIPFTENTNTERYVAIASSMEDWILEKIDRERLQAAVRQFVNKLHPNHTEVLYRYYFDGEQLKDIAAEKGVTKGAINHKAWDARERLRKLIEESVVC